MLTITANLIDLTGTNDVGWVTFTLVGYGTNVPRIGGTCNITQPVIKALANGSGNISQVILGNDVITPTGTLYEVRVFSNVGSQISVAKYSLTGSGSKDLSVLTPIAS